MKTSSIHPLHPQGSPPPPLIIKIPLLYGVIATLGGGHHCVGDGMTMNTVSVAIAQVQWVHTCQNPEAKTGFL